MKPIRVCGRRVKCVLDEWRVTDRWWTDDPVSNEFCSVLLDGDAIVTLRRAPGAAWDFLHVEKRPRFRLIA